MPPKPVGGRFVLAGVLILGMFASLIWFNIQTSRRYAVQAIAEALGPNPPDFVIDGERDFLRAGSLSQYNNLWCGTVTSGPPRQFAVLVRQPGRSRMTGEQRRRGSPVLDFAIAPAAAPLTDNQSAMLATCAELRG